MGSNLIEGGLTKNVFDRIAKDLKKRVGTTDEFEVVEEEKDKTSQGFFDSFVLSDEYEQALKLKKNLLKKYEGKTIEDVFTGQEQKNSFGNFYKITAEKKLKLKNVEESRAQSKILSNLQLLNGIGPIKEAELKTHGYNTVNDLCNHLKWGFQAKELVKLVGGKDTPKIHEHLWKWIPKSHPLGLYCAGFHKPEDFVIFDIETLGLFGRPIILIGVGTVEGGEKIKFEQYFMRDVPEEKAALSEFVSTVKDKTLISFNGRSFDAPYIEERMGYYGKNVRLANSHFDMLHFSRWQWREKFENCRLVTLEKNLFGIERQDDVPSALVPEFYESYLEEKNIGPVIPIIKHNQQDIETLARIFSRLFEEWEDGNKQISR